MGSVIFEKTASYVFSSNPALGAINISPDGSEFTVAMDNPIDVPHGVVDCTIDVLAASIWNVSPNISASFGNNMFYFSQAGTPYVVTIADGLYSLPQLNNYLSRFFVNNGLQKNQIVFSGDDSTQKSIITFNFVGTQIDFTQPNTIRSILGFNSQLLPAGGPSTIQGENYVSDTIATFNRINFFYVKSNLVNSGLPLNGTPGNIIAQIPITATPGSQINYSPQNVISINARTLSGNSFQSIRMSLLDDQLRPVNTLGEFWSITLHVHMQYLLSTVGLPILP